jgi:hypothetical protein
MRTWLRRLHLLLTVGGGFNGVTICLLGLWPAYEQKPAAVIVMAVGIVLFACAIVIGMRVFEGRTARMPLLWFYALQIPILSSPGFSFHISAGAHFNVGFVGAALMWHAQLGADYAASLLSDDPWGLGVNLFALALFIAAKGRNDI